jgi:hypothetical protein
MSENVASIRTLEKASLRASAVSFWGHNFLKSVVNAERTI